MRWRSSQGAQDIEGVTGKALQGTRPSNSETFARGYHGGNSYGDGELTLLAQDGRLVILKVQQGEPAKWKQQVAALAQLAFAKLGS